MNSSIPIFRANMVNVLLYYMFKTVFYHNCPKYLDIITACHTYDVYPKYLGPVVQNLTKLLANMTLNFLCWNMANTFIFFVEKLYIFAAKKYQCIWKYLSYNS